MFNFNQPKLKLGIAFTRRDTWMNKETETNKNDIIKKVSILAKSQDIEVFSTENLEVEFVVPSKIYSNSNDLIGKSIYVLWKGGTTSLKTMKGIIERSDGKTNEEEGGGKLFARIDKFEKRENYIPLGTFVRVDYPVGDFKNVFKLPESSLYIDKVYIVENGIAKPKKIKLIYKGSGYILVDGNLSENDYIITTRIPENLNNQKIKILN